MNIETKRIQTLSRMLEAIRQFEALLRIDSDAAEETIERACQARPASCPRCGEPRCYVLGGARARCSRCRYTFRLLTSRWLGRLRVPARSWLILVKCFELALNGRQAAELTGLSIPTFYRGYSALRMAIAALDERWVPLVGSGRRLLAGPQVFGVLLDAATVRVVPLEALPGRSAPMPVLHENGFVYAAGREGYHALVCHGRWREVLRGPKTRAADPFLASLMGGAMRWHGIPARAFPLYLKELEFRYNRRGMPFFDELLEAAARRVPRADGG